MGWINERLFGKETEKTEGKLVQLSDNDTHLPLPYPSRNEELFPVSIYHNENGTERKIEFDFGCKFQNNMPDGASYSLFKESFLLDGQIPEGVVNEINEQVGTLLYPVHALINKEGHINYFETSLTLQKRWTSLRKDLMHNYKGKILEGLLETIDKIIKDDAKLHAVYKNDLATNLMFQGIFGKYNKQYKKQSTLWLPQLGNKTNNYAGLQMDTYYQLMPYRPSDEDFILKLDGQLDNKWWDASGNQLWADAEKPDEANGKTMIATMSGEIWLDKMNRTLLGMEITINQTFGDWRKTTVVKVNA